MTCSTLELAAEVTKVLTFSARRAALHHMSGLVVSCAWLFCFFFFSCPNCLKWPRKKNRHGQKESRGGWDIITRHSHQYTQQILNYFWWEWRFLVIHIWARTLSRAPYQVLWHTHRHIFYKVRCSANRAYSILGFGVWRWLGLGDDWPWGFPWGGEGHQQLWRVGQTVPFSLSLHCCHLV